MIEEHYCSMVFVSWDLEADTEKEDKKREEKVDAKDTDAENGAFPAET
jgi:hypothetical protein